MKAGVHLANDGKLTDEQWGLIGNLHLVKALVRIDEPWGEIDWVRLAASIRPDCTVVLRIYFPGRLEPGEFIERSARKLPPILETLGDRETLIEIHNEPNHASGKEGWGRADDYAVSFGQWYSRVLRGLRACGFTNLGWPGLAVGDWAHNERVWAIINRVNIRFSDWVGVHCYWQRPEHLYNELLGENWRYYRNRWPNKRIVVTECGNSSCDNPGLPQMNPQRQAAEYLEWCHVAGRGGVAGVAFYMLGGSDDWAGFKIHPETVRALEGLTWT